MEVIQEGRADILRVHEQAKAGGAGKGKSGRLKQKGTKSTRAYTRGTDKALPFGTMKHKMAVGLLFTYSILKYLSCQV